MNVLLLFYFILNVYFSAATLTISVPRNFCELDNIDSCRQDQCIRYDPRKFQTSRSVVSYLPHDRRLGNTISAYIILLWINLEHGLHVFIDKPAYNQLKSYFKNLNKTPVKVLEENLCDWEEFGFRKFSGSVAQMGNPDWAYGKAIEIVSDQNNVNWLQFQGSGKYFKKHEKQTRGALEMHDHFQRHAQITLQKIANKVGKPSAKLTYVGVHDRRTDYLDFRKRVLMTDDLDEEYISDSIDYFRDEYGDNSLVVFVYTSDDIKWGMENLGHEKYVFFAGCGNAYDPDCIGKDFALLSACNHTIVTHGSLGLWAAFLAGGEIYTEYGTIVPEAFV